MNTISDGGRKTSINSLLNPEASSNALTSGLTHLANASMSAAAAANHQLHAQSHSVAAYEAQHYGVNVAANGGSYHLRAADWSVSDDRHEFSTANGSPRYQQPSPGSFQHPKDQTQECPSPPAATTSRTRPPAHPYAHTQSWPPPTPTGIPYGFQMYSDERTALSGDYQHHVANSYASAYNSEASSSMPESLQTTDRASVRLAARETMQGAAVYPAAIIYAPYVISAPPPAVQKPTEQQPTGQSVRVISPPASQNKRPASEEADSGNPKTKKTRGNGNKSAPTPSKRGYSAKKRNEAAQIAAQNAAAMIPNVSYTALPDAKGKQKADTRMQIVPSETGQAAAVNTSMGLLTPEMQFARCMSNRYKNDQFPRCVSCTRRWAGDTCRFQGIRFFLKNANKDLVGVSFLESQKEDAPSMEFSNSWNLPLEKKHLERTKRTIAQALLPILQKEQAHFRLPDIIHRPRESDVRATCDTCMTSIFSSSWMCRLCGREACAECYSTVSELTAERPGADPMEVAALQARRERHAHSNPFFLSCTRRNEHTSKDFSPVSRFCDAELTSAVKGMEELMGVAPTESASTTTEKTPSNDENSGKENETVDQPAELQESGSQQEKAPEVAEPAAPADVSIADGTNNQPDEPMASPDTEAKAPIPQPLEGEVYKPNSLSETTLSIPTHTIPRYQDEDLTEDNFPSVWVEGRPLVVEGVARKFKIQWTPEYFKEKHGTESCIIIECQTETNKRITVGEFFTKFGEYEDRDQCWKLKDWPMSTDFKSAYPDLYEDFSQAVPVPSYVRRDGVLNIASHFPSNTVSPDLGPKMYNAMASGLEAGSKGSTRLHMDMADALNIMTYAEPCPDGSEGCAAWDLFRAEDSDKIRKFLIDKFGPSKAKVSKEASNTANGESVAAPPTTTPTTPAIKHTGQEWTGHTDPIHGQQFYLDEDLLKELHEKTGVMSYRHYQRPGEAIFIPAGCAHQVANLADCIKVAVDYVSPENIERCERLTREFREQNQRKVWKEDVLQLRTMMWFAWLSCCQQEAKLKSALEIVKGFNAGQAEAA